jgi:hypothetical protein
MGVLAYVPLPPSVSPPYMTFCHPKRGFNGVNEIFVKKFLEKFLGKNWNYSPLLINGGVFLFDNIVY